ncbi:lamin tail domain-containing protein [Candidatus Bipolaricaulota bacterium]
MKKVAWVTICVCLGLVVGAVGCLGTALVISEVAWAGTAASGNDEWIELHNQGDEAIDLAGWQLTFGDTLIPLADVGEDTLEARIAVLAPDAFMILERTNDDSISDITADLIYKGALSNGGIVIELRNPEGEIVDSVLLVEDGWPAGGASDSEPPYCSMERIGADGWISNNGIIRNGLDLDGNPLNGTPGQRNSADVLAQWAPTVELGFPTDEGRSLSGIEAVAWVASDPDGASSALSISILLSANEGDDWSILIENLANTGSFTWDTTAHPSGDKYRLLVRALDPEGYVGEATSPLFVIANGD